MKNIPQKIYLQIDADGETLEDFNELAEVSWCAEKIHDNDIEYTLSDSSLPVQGEKEEDFKQWLENNCDPHKEKQPSPDLSTLIEAIEKAMRLLSKHMPKKIPVDDTKQVAAYSAYFTLREAIRSCPSSTSPIESYKKLCEIAGVPQVLIDNPDLLFNNPTPEVIEWAKAVAQKDQLKSSTADSQAELATKMAMAMTGLSFFETRKQFILDNYIIAKK